MTKQTYLSEQELERLLNRVDTLEKTVNSLVNLFNPDYEDWVVRPVFPEGVIADQDYYYSDEWKAVEAEIAEDEQLGRSVTFDSVGEARDYLKSIMEESDEVTV